MTNRFYWLSGNTSPGPGPSPGLRAFSPTRPTLPAETGRRYQGAHVFVNVTNDSWFGTWAEPRQHLFMTLARGIEFRRPVIRSTNTGISTVMLADGTILERSPLHREWFQSYDVPYRKDPFSTVYQSYGYRLVPAILFLAAAILLGVGRKPGGVPVHGWRDRHPLPRRGPLASSLDLR